MSVIGERLALALLILQARRLAGLLSKKSSFGAASAPQVAGVCPQANDAARQPKQVPLCHCANLS